MDILITSTYYWPEAAGNAPYVTGLAEYLASKGHRVTVATGFPHYPAWRSTAGRRLAAKERRHGVEVRRRWHYVPRVQSAQTRGIYEASLCAFGLTALPARRPNLVVGVVPTLSAAVLARAAAVFYRRPYVLLFQDLLGPAALQSGIDGGQRIAALVERMELRLARHATGVIVISDGFGRYFKDHGVKVERIHRLRNWAQNSHHSEKTVAETRRELGWSADDFVCLHAGNMGHKQGLENVLRAAAVLDDPTIRIVLAGDGNERARLEEEASNRELGNLTFLPLQAPGRYEEMLSAADLLIVNQRASVGEMSLASKLTSYFIAGRPIVGAVARESETAMELRAAGAGMLVQPDDPRELARAITWVREHPDRAAEYARMGMEYAGTHLSAPVVLDSYEELLRRLQGEAARR